MLGVYRWEAGLGHRSKHHFGGHLPPCRGTVTSGACLAWCPRSYAPMRTPARERQAAAGHRPGAGTPCYAMPTCTRATQCTGARGTQPAPLQTPPWTRVTPPPPPAFQPWRELYSGGWLARLTWSVKVLSLARIWPMILNNLVQWRSLRAGLRRACAGPGAGQEQSTLALQRLHSPIIVPLVSWLALLTPRESCRQRQLLRDCLCARTVHAWHCMCCRASCTCEGGWRDGQLCGSMHSPKDTRGAQEHASPCTPTHCQCMCKPPNQPQHQVCATCCPTWMMGSSWSCSPTHPPYLKSACLTNALPTWIMGSSWRSSSTRARKAGTSLLGTRPRSMRSTDLWNLCVGG